LVSIDLFEAFEAMCKSSAHTKMVGMHVFSMGHMGYLGDLGRASIIRQSNVLLSSGMAPALKYMS
jgi:hypothetical protein